MDDELIQGLAASATDKRTINYLFDRIAGFVGRYTNALSFLHTQSKAFSQSRHGQNEYGTTSIRRAHRFTATSFGCTTQRSVYKHLYTKNMFKMVLLTWTEALVSTPSLRSRLMALQMGLEHRKEFPWEWRRSTGGNGVASCS